MSRSKRAFLTMLLAASAMLAGCPAPQPVKLEPIPRPPGVAARVDAEVERTALALGGATLIVSVVKAGTTERIPGATLSLIGPTLGSADIRQGTNAYFSPLIPGTYQVRVSAPGYQTRVEGNMSLEAKQELEREIALVPEEGTVLGRVVANGSPVWGARVMLGDAWTFTAQDGSFALRGAGAGTLKVRRGGMEPLNRDVAPSGETRLGDLSLAPLAGKRRVMLINPLEAFGSGTVGTALGPLMTAVEATSTLARTDAAAQANVRLLASPKAAPNAAELQAFVAGGGTLVVTGEWGGFGDYDPEAVNAVTRPFGLAVRPDLVRIAGQSNPSEWLTASLNPLLPTSQGVSGLALYTACSITTTPMATAIADSGASGYRVQTLSAGALTLAAAVPHGEGLLVLVGDTSAWTTSHLQEAGNKQFMLNLFGW
jgi:hypothetical protein